MAPCRSRGPAGTGSSRAGTTPGRHARGGRIAGRLRAPARSGGWDRRRLRASGSPSFGPPGDAGRHSVISVRRIVPPRSGSVAPLHGLRPSTSDGLPWSEGTTRRLGARRWAGMSRRTGPSFDRRGINGSTTRAVTRRTDRHRPQGQDEREADTANDWQVLHGVSPSRGSRLLGRRRETARAGGGPRTIGPHRAADYGPFVMQQARGGPRVAVRGREEGSGVVAAGSPPQVRGARAQREDPRSRIGTGGRPQRAVS